MDGFNDLSKQLKKMSKEIEKVSKHDGELKDILNNSFISRNTKFANYEEFMESLPINLNEITVNLQELKNEELDKHVDQNTTSSNWITFLNKALEEYMAKKLNNIFK